MWQTAMLKDHMGYYMEPYLFYFEQGINRIRLVFEKEPVVLGQIRLLQAERPPTYAEISSLYDERGYRPAQDFFLKIQAEDAKYKSEQTLYPVHDKGDPSLEPYHPVEIRLNSIGGLQLATPWTVDFMGVRGSRRWPVYDRSSLNRISAGARIATGGYTSMGRSRFKRSMQSGLSSPPCTT